VPRRSAGHFFIGCNKGHEVESAAVKLLPREDRIFGSASTALLVASLVALTHPYYGIWHDSVLYLGQALATSQPQLSDDLFFKYGSQARFTLLPHALGLAIQVGGTGFTLKALTAASLLAFFAASALLLSRLLPARLVPYSLAAIAILPSFYGIRTCFSYAEPFFTGRSVAEPLCLIAIALVLDGRRITVAIAVLAIAAAAHPLPALPASAIVLLLLIRQDRRWIALALPVVIGTAICALVPGAGASALIQLDPLWLGLLQRNSPMLFIGRAGRGDLLNIATDFFLLIEGVRRAPTVHFRNVAVATLTVAAAGLLADLILVDIMHLAWPAALQFWRALWLLHWLAIAVVPMLVWQLWRQQPGQKARIAVLFAIGAAGLPPSAASDAVIGLMAIYWLWPCLFRGNLARLESPVALGIACAGIALLLHGGTPFVARAPNDTSKASEFTTIVAPLLLVALFPAAIAARHNRMLKAGILFFLSCALFFACRSWDRRTPEVLAIEETDPESVSPGMPLNATVQWIGDLTPTWALLRRTSYFNAQQAAGSVFNRGTALEAERRRNIVNSLRKASGETCQLAPETDSGVSTCLPDAMAIGTLCNTAWPDLDYVIMDYHLQGQTGDTWTLKNGAFEKTYSIYKCAKMVQK
jgi:hypothetical protein